MIFSEESDKMPANIEIKRYWDSRKTKMIEKSFEAFYESLDDFDK